MDVLVVGGTRFVGRVACEVAAREAFPGPCLVVRPGYVVEPNDPTDRFTWYVRRAAAGGRMPVPRPPDTPMQVARGSRDGFR